jgi:hypothetical protein
VRSCLILLLTFLSASCTPFGGFKPVPDQWTDYRKSGLTERQIYTALMECGWPYPHDLRWVPLEVKEHLGINFPNTTEGINNFANLARFTERCMANAGISSKYQISCLTQDQETKKWTKLREIPACQPNAVIPKRSVETRLNSRFCKEYPNARACQLDPEAPYIGPQSSSSNTQQKPVEPFDQKLNRQLQEQQFQNQVRQQSNSQMNDLLKSTSPKK